MLNPLEAIRLKISQNEGQALCRILGLNTLFVEQIRYNSTINQLVLYNFYKSKKESLRKKALTKAQFSQTLKPHEARALHNELQLYPHNPFLILLLGKLDQAIVNQSFNQTNTYNDTF